MASEDRGLKTASMISRLMLLIIYCQGIQNKQNVRLVFFNLNTLRTKNIVN